MKSKKQFTLLIALLLIFVCAGCGKKPVQEPTPVTETAGQTVSETGYETFADLMADPDVSREQSAYDGGTRYVSVYEKDGVYYRAVCLSPDQKTMDALFELDFDDPDREEKELELLKTVHIDRIENLSERIIPQEELDKLIGKTGKELLDDGWIAGGSYDLDEMVFWMDKGMFTYAVQFEKNGVSLVNSDDFNDYEAVQPLIVKSVTFAWLGDATEAD